MGLIASLGALIPLLLFFRRVFSRAKGLFLLAGMALVVFGIALCSIAEPAARHLKANPPQHGQTLSKIGLAIAIFAAYSLACPTWHGIRGKRDPGCRVAGSVPGCFQEIRMGSSVYPGGRR